MVTAKALLDFLVAHSKPSRVLDLLAYGEKSIPIAATEKLVDVLSCRDAYHSPKYASILVNNRLLAVGR